MEIQTLKEVVDNGRPSGSRMDSALSRMINISSEERRGRKGVRSSGFSTPAPMTLDSRARKLAGEAAN